MVSKGNGVSRGTYVLPVTRWRPDTQTRVRICVYHPVKCKKYRQYFIQEIETLLSCNIECMGSRECNRGLPMASSWYSVPKEYNKMH
jgi:hypothetical protein